MGTLQSSCEFIDYSETSITVYKYNITNILVTIFFLFTCYVAFKVLEFCIYIKMSNMSEYISTRDLNIPNEHCGTVLSTMFFRAF